MNIMDKNDIAKAIAIHQQKPSIFDLYVTSECNSRCKTCSIWASPKVELHANLVIGLMCSYPDGLFIFGGGEFILHPEAGRIIEYANEHGIDYVMLSNCVDAGKLMRFCEQHKPKQITISFDGSRHDIIRGIEGNTQSIMQFLVWNKKRGYPTTIRLAYTISEYNMKYTEQDMNIVENMVDTLLVEPNLYVTLQQNLAVFEKKERGVSLGFNRGCLLKYGFISRTTQNYLAGYFKDEKPICASPIYFASIMSDGSVRFCQSYRFKEVLGNINDESFDSIWKRNTRRLYEDSHTCPHKDQCMLACHRRYDYK